MAATAGQANVRMRSGAVAQPGRHIGVSALHGLGGAWLWAALVVLALGLTVPCQARSISPRGGPRGPAEDTGPSASELKVTEASDLTIKASTITGLSPNVGQMVPLRVDFSSPRTAFTGTIEVLFESQIPVVTQEVNVGSGSYTFWLYPVLTNGIDSVTVVVHDQRRRVVAASMRLDLTRPESGDFSLPQDKWSALSIGAAGRGVSGNDLVGLQPETVIAELSRRLFDAASVRHRELSAELLQATTDDRDRGAVKAMLQQLSLTNEQIVRNDALTQFSGNTLALLTELRSLHEMASRLRLDGNNSYFSSQSVLPIGSRLFPGIQVAHIVTADQAPDSWLGYSDMRVVFWHGGRPLTFDRQQREALETWVRSGGHLIMTAKAGETTIVPPSPRLIPSIDGVWSAEPESAQAVRRFSPRLAADDPGWLVSVTPPSPSLKELNRDAETTTTDGKSNEAAAEPAINWPLARRYHVGLGIVDVLLLDEDRISSLSSEEWSRLLGFSNAEGLVIDDNLIKELPGVLVEANRLIEEGYGSYDGSYKIKLQQLLTERLGSIDQEEIRNFIQMTEIYRRNRLATDMAPRSINAQPVLIFGAVLLVLISLGDYLVLRRLKRLPLTWITAPLLIVLAAAVVWLLFLRSRDRSPHITRFSEVRDLRQGSPSGRMFTWTSVLNRENRALTATLARQGRLDRGNFYNRRATYNGYRYGYGYRYNNYYSDVLISQKASRVQGNMDGTAGVTIDSYIGAFDFYGIEQVATDLACPYTVSLARSTEAVSANGDRNSDGRVPVVATVTAKEGVALPTLGFVMCDGKVTGVKNISMPTKWDNLTYHGVLSGLVAPFQDRYDYYNRPKDVTALILDENHALPPGYAPEVASVFAQTLADLLCQHDLGEADQPAADITQSVRDGRDAIVLLVEPPGPDGVVRMWRILLPAP